MSDNLELGRFDLLGIPLAPRGLAQLEVSFDSDANGIDQVSAKDLGAAKRPPIRITAPKEKVVDAEYEESGGRS